MNRLFSTLDEVAASVPRASGDEPDGQGMLFKNVSVFPAPAGMNRERCGTGHLH